MRKRRFETLLPLKFNDGRNVDPELFEQTREELIAQFGALSIGPNTRQGFWVHEGVRYEDELFCWIIDVDDTPENLEFFVNYKSVLKERFQQVEIYIISYPIERV